MPAVTPNDVTIPHSREPILDPFPVTGFDEKNNTRNEKPNGTW
jgi:hypothetical protein